MEHQHGTHQNGDDDQAHRNVREGALGFCILIHESKYPFFFCGREAWGNSHAVIIMRAYVPTVYVRT